MTNIYIRQNIYDVNHRSISVRIIVAFRSCHIYMYIEADLAPFDDFYCTRIIDDSLIKLETRWSIVRIGLTHERGERVYGI